MLNVTLMIFAGGTGLMWLAFIALSIISFIVSKSVESKFRKYANIPMNYGMTGRQVAEKMLYDNDIHDVTVQEVNGTLSDHYNPANKTLNLSHDVYHGTSVAAAAVAAHECGHAVQHATGYAWLQMRSTLVPTVSFSNKFVMWLLLAGLLLVNKLGTTLLLIGIGLYAITTIFSIVTLPVEINASKRALVWLNTHNITSPDTHRYAESALRSAAYTYVMAALTSLATLFYYIMIYNRR